MLSRFESTREVTMRNPISQTGLVFAIALCMTVACWAQTGTATHADNAFLKKAMEGSETEIELGHLAQTKAQDPRVKEFANMMITDHTQALNRLHDAMGTSPGSTYNKNKQTDPTRSAGGIHLSKQDQQTKNRLSKLSGAEFDRAYMDAMVTDHRKDVREFETEAALAPASDASRQKPGTNANENSAPAIARELLPTLKKHLQEAESIQQELGQTK
jgi:putative membrane protein